MSEKFEQKIGPSALGAAEGPARIDRAWGCISDHGKRDQSWGRLMKQNLFFPLCVFLFPGAQVLVTSNLPDTLDVFILADRLYQFDSSTPVLAFDPGYPCSYIEQINRTLPPEKTNRLQRFACADMPIFQNQFIVHLKHLSALSSFAVQSIGTDMQSLCQLRYLLSKSCKRS